MEKQRLKFPENTWLSQGEQKPVCLNSFNSGSDASFKLQLLFANQKKKKCYSKSKNVIDSFCFTWNHQKT